MDCESLRWRQKKETETDTDTTTEIETQTERDGEEWGQQQQCVLRSTALKFLRLKLCEYVQNRNQTKIHSKIHTHCTHVCMYVHISTARQRFLILSRKRNLKQ